MSESPDSDGPGAESTDEFEWIEDSENTENTRHVENTKNVDFTKDVKKLVVVDKKMVEKEEAAARLYRIRDRARYARFLALSRIIDERSQKMWN